LLSPTHPVGKNKFRWLSSTFGFEEGDGALFEHLIREQLPRAGEIREKDPKPDKANPRIVYRRWEIIILRFRGPNGNTQSLLTAWALEIRGMTGPT